MLANIVPRILATYGIAVRRIYIPQTGYRNVAYPIKLQNGHMINVIIYKHEPGIVTLIKNAHMVARVAAQKGLPARTTYDDRIIQMKKSSYTRYAALYHYLPGNTIPWEAYTMAHLKALGTALGNLHTALQTITRKNLPNIAQECLHLNHRLLSYFAQPGVQMALRKKLGLKVAYADFTHLLTICQKLPKQQALHMDFVRGNILFQGKTISGILDFEKTAHGHVVFDIARTLAFLLVDCKYKPEQKVRKYFLQSGYNKYSSAQFLPVIIKGKGVLEELITFFLLHDFYKFLLHNPYQSLPQNEHFVRTKAMLLKRGIIKNANGTIK